MPSLTVRTSSRRADLEFITPRDKSLLLRCNVVLGNLLVMNVFQSVFMNLAKTPSVYGKDALQFLKLKKAEIIMIAIEKKIYYLAWRNERPEPENALKESGVSFSTFFFDFPLGGRKNLRVPIWKL